MSWKMISRGRFPEFRDRTEGYGWDMGWVWSPWGNALSKLQDRNGASGVPGHPPHPPEQDLSNIPCQWWGGLSTCHGPNAVTYVGPKLLGPHPTLRGSALQDLPCHRSSDHPASRPLPGAQNRQQWRRWGRAQEMGPQGPTGSWSGPGSSARRTPLSLVHPLPHTASRNADSSDAKRQSFRLKALPKWPVSKHCRIPLRWGPWCRQLMDQSGRRCRGCGKGWGVECCGIWFCKMKSSRDGGDGSTRWIYLMPQKRALKMVMMVKGMWRVLFRLK